MNTVADVSASEDDVQAKVRKRRLRIPKVIETESSDCDDGEQAPPKKVLHSCV